VIFGSPTLVRSLAEADLIDEYHFLMHPVIVEVGERLFDEIETRTDVNLKSVTTLSEGGVVVAYARVES
jgi:dihydrofolate reductase